MEIQVTDTFYSTLGKTAHNPVYSQDNGGQRDDTTCLRPQESHFSFCSTMSHKGRGMKSSKGFRVHLLVRSQFLQVALSRTPGSASASVGCFLWQQPGSTHKLCFFFIYDLWKPVENRHVKEQCTLGTCRVDNSLILVLNLSFSVVVLYPQDTRILPAQSPLNVCS